MADSVAVGIRLGVGADVERLAAFGARAFREAYAGQVDGGELEVYVARAFAVPQIASELADPASRFLLAEAEPDAGLVGYARLREEEAPAGVTGPHPLRLVRIYVGTERIGSGVGAALMSACVAEARRAGHGGLWLRVWEHNDRAIRFYERGGFRRCGAIAFDMLGDVKTDLVLRLDLA